MMLYPPVTSDRRIALSFEHSSSMQQHTRYLPVEIVPLFYILDPLVQSPSKPGVLPGTHC
jgi:hypothetical protein